MGGSGSALVVERGVGCVLLCVPKELRFVAIIALTNGQVVPVAGEMFEGTVVLRDGVISDLGANVEVPADAEVVDVAGQYVLPGLVDAHSHIGAWEDGEGWAGEDTNEMSAAVTAAVRVMDAINPLDAAFGDARAGGVTTINVLPGSANVIGGLAVAFSTAGTVMDDMVLRHPSGMKSALGENPKRIHGNQNRAPSTRMAVAQIIRETLLKAQDYMATRKAKPETPTDLAMEHVSMVLRREIPWRQHCHRADDIMTALRLQREFGYELVLDHGTEAYLVADKVAAAGVPALIGPTIVARSKVECRNQSLQAPAILHKAGVQVSLITDHPIVPTPYLITQAALAVREGLPREAALQMVTLNPAKVLGLSHQLGSLTKGKRADVTVWSGDPLSIQSRVTRTFIGGELVHEYV